MLAAQVKLAFPQEGLTWVSSSPCWGCTSRPPQTRGCSAWWPPQMTPAWWVWSGHPEAAPGSLDTRWPPSTPAHLTTSGGGRWHCTGLMTVSSLRTTLRYKTVSISVSSELIHLFVKQWMCKCPATRELNSHWQLTLLRHWRVKCQPTWQSLAELDNSGDDRDHVLDKLVPHLVRVPSIQHRHHLTEVHLLNTQHHLTEVHLNTQHHLTEVHLNTQHHLTEVHLNTQHHLTEVHLNTQHHLTEVHLNTQHHLTEVHLNTQHHLTEVHLNTQHHLTEVHLLNIQHHLIEVHLNKQHHLMDSQWGCEYTTVV